jgi:hypothetical protein
MKLDGLLNESENRVVWETQEKLVFESVAVTPGKDGPSLVFEGLLDFRRWRFIVVAKYRYAIAELLKYASAFKCVTDSAAVHERNTERPDARQVHLNAPTIEASNESDFARAFANDH